MRDISLSEAHGGLRIANPDDSDATGIRDLSLGNEDTQRSNLSMSNKLAPEPVSRSRTPLLDSFPILNETSASTFDTSTTQVGAGPPDLPAYLTSYSNVDPRSSPATSSSQRLQPSMAHGGSRSRDQLWRSLSASQIRPNEVARSSKTPRDKSHAAAVGPSSTEPSRASMYVVSTKGDPMAMSGRPTRERSFRDNTQKAINRRPLPPDSGALPPPRRSSRGQTGGYVSSQPANPTPSRSREPEHDLPQPGNTAEWQERGAAVSYRREIDANGNATVRSVRRGVNDFEFGKILGEGSYSTVYAATDRHSHKEYAIKCLDKRHIIKEKKIKYVNIEKNTLNRLTDHPGIVRLYYTFQDERSLYYVLDLCTGGELLGVLKQTGTFSIECTRYYGAQILDAVEYMHKMDVIHRDLKPENVLLDNQMHVKVTDFGTAKLLIRDGATEQVEESKAASFVGTAEYVSPELLVNKSAGKPSDIWAFGCIIYQLLAGRPPFKGGTEYLTFQKIVNLEYDFPPNFPPAARDLVERCLVIDPSTRITIEHIKSLPFFAGQTFGKDLWSSKAPKLAPYMPNQEPHVISPNGAASHTPSVSTSSRGLSTANGANRPSRIITELPPPTQLDIEWSPVLTRTNERILKLGDLMVVSSPLPNAQGEHGDGHKKLSRFFGGSNTKRRERLVMVTSSGRIVLAPAGGDEKKSKQEIPLMAADCKWHTQIDSKGQPVWCVDSNGVHYTFELPKGASHATDPSPPTVDEWIEALNKAKDLGAVTNPNGTYEEDNEFGNISTSTTPASTLGRNVPYPEGGFGISDRSGRNQLSKAQNSPDETQKRHRFSKRQSKNGLVGTAAF